MRVALIAAVSTLIATAALADGHTMSGKGTCVSVLVGGSGYCVGGVTYWP